MLLKNNNPGERFIIFKWFNVENGVDLSCLVISSGSDSLGELRVVYPSSTKSSFDPFCLLTGPWICKCKLYPFEWTSDYFCYCLLHILRKKTKLFDYTFIKFSSIDLFINIKSSLDWNLKLTQSIFLSYLQFVFDKNVQL